MEYKYVNHMFMSNHTIYVAVQLYNNHTNDKDLIDKLLQHFCEVNNNEVPKVGRSYKIPIAIQHNE